MIPEAWIPWIIVGAGLIGFYFVFKILKKAIGIAFVILVIAIIGAVIYVML